MSIISLLCVLLSLLLQTCESTTILVDGVSQWNDPSVFVGDTVIFKHKYGHYSLYIFQNQRAFNLCNFTQATLLTKTNPSYTWHPSRAGLFYFTFKNESVSATTCPVGSQKLAIRVSTVSPPAEPPVGSAPAPGYPWPFKPKQASASASPPPERMATVMPDKGGGGGGGIPFINSNPAVPLPTGEVDSATITPLTLTSAMPPPPTPDQVVNVFALLWMALLMMLMRES